MLDVYVPLFCYTSVCELTCWI